MKYIIITLLLFIIVSTYGQDDSENKYRVRFIIGGMDTTINLDSTNQKVEFDFKIIETLYRESENDKMSGDKFSFKVGIFIPDSLTGILFNPFIKISAYNKNKQLVAKDSCNHYFTFYKNRNDYFINSYSGSLFGYSLNDERFNDAKVFYDEEIYCTKANIYKLSFVLSQDSIRTPSYIRNNHDIFSSEPSEYNTATDWINQLIQISNEKKVKDIEKEDKIQKIQSGEILPQIDVYIKIVQYYKANTPSYNQTNAEYYYETGGDILLDEKLSGNEFPISNTFEFETGEATIPLGYKSATTTAFKMEFTVVWKDLIIPLTTFFDIRGTTITRKEIINKDGTNYDSEKTNAGHLTLEFSNKYKIDISISQ